VRFAAGHGRVEKLTLARIGSSGEFFDPADRYCAALDAHCAGRSGSERAVFAEPHGACGVVVGDHADHHVGTHSGFARRSGDMRAFSSEGRGFVAVAVENCQRKSVGEKTPRHARTHEAETEKCDARFAHKKSSQGFYRDQRSRAAHDAQRIAQRATEAFKLDDHHIAVRELDARAEAQTARAEIVDVQVVRAAMRLELEMVMLNIGEAVTHFFFAGLNRLRP
jgi:hypothetical protein